MTLASPLSVQQGANHTCALGCSMHCRVGVLTAGVKPTPPGCPLQDTAGCLWRLLCSPRLAMALWPYLLVVVECT